MQGAPFRPQAIRRLEAPPMISADEDLMPPSFDLCLDTPMRAHHVPFVTSFASLVPSFRRLSPLYTKERGIFTAVDIDLSLGVGTGGAVGAGRSRRASGYVWGSPG